MNDSTLREIHAAYLAALIDGRCSVSVSTEKRKPYGSTVHRLKLKVWFASASAPSLFEWMDAEKQFQADLRRADSGLGKGYLLFRNKEAAKVWTAVWPHLRNPIRRQQAQECFKFFRTQFGAGYGRRPERGFQETREDVRRELLRLAEKEIA